jgi:hypothetical protein
VLFVFVSVGSAVGSNFVAFVSVGSPLAPLTSGDKNPKIILNALTIVEPDSSMSI